MMKYSVIFTEFTEYYWIFQITEYSNWEDYWIFSYWIFKWQYWLPVNLSFRVIFTDSEYIYLEHYKCNDDTITTRRQNQESAWELWTQGTRRQNQHEHQRR